MSKKITVGAIVLALVLIIIGCSAPISATAPATSTSPTVITTAPPPAPPTPKPSGSIKAKWIEPQVSGATVSIPVNELKSNWNTVFKITKQGSTLNFMAYSLDGELYVRASTCPPCRGITYSLDSDILVCDTCGTTFKAKTGAGIKGPCVNYPKAVVQYKIVDGNIVMNEADLVNSYQETIKPG
jgi:nitrite reductase/ring-hydroxylating ferredoxin subunit